ncbi:uncharacterized protein CXorf65 homolog isoform X2 [Osmerus eperlanus]|uniref:uncharacterized protein CXorf65 homolog isoform X2 n=1 Tax=Osmerus eperlanus TaxID=29151 RepID=UPI002E11102E
MFLYIKHGDNETFLASTNCRVVVLLQYMRSKLGLPESELVDLCDDKGSLKLMFQSHLSQEYCSQLLASRCTFTVCVINKTLQTQTESLERARLRHLRSQEDRRSTEMPTQAQPTQPAKGRGRAVHVEAPDEEPQRRPAGKRGRN